eukprot:COSAG05_NODE_3508_length_2020_cov_2.252473_2_plen_300_part_00
MSAFRLLLLLAAEATAASAAAAAARPSNNGAGLPQQQQLLPKSIDFYLNFPARAVDFLIGNNSGGWANTTKGLDISKHTRSVYQCCNGFLLGMDGMQEYSHGPNNGTNSWGQAAYVAAGKEVHVNIDPKGTASDVCNAALARKELYAKELLAIATREHIAGFVTDWEDATGNNMTCFNALFGYVSSVLKPHGIGMSMSMDASNHQGPMDLNSTAPWSAEWDWLGAVQWGRTLIDMGTYPGGWSKGLSDPAAQFLHAFPCPKYPQKTCGIEGQVDLADYKNYQLLHTHITYSTIIYRNLT